MEKIERGEAQWKASKLVTKSAYTGGLSLSELHLGTRWARCESDHRLGRDKPFRCGMRWVCERSSRKHFGLTYARLLKLMLAWRRLGGELATATLSIPHQRSTSLADGLERAAAERKTLFTGRRWKKLCDDFAIAAIGYWGLEITYDEGGWIPHYHLILLMNPTAQARDVDGLQQALNRQVLGANPRANTRTPVVVKGVEHAGEARVASYVTKGSFGTVRKLLGVPDGMNRATAVALLLELHAATRSTAKQRGGPSRSSTGLTGTCFPHSAQLALLKLRGQLLLAAIAVSARALRTAAGRVRANVLMRLSSLRPRRRRRRVTTHPCGKLRMQLMPRKLGGWFRRAIEGVWGRIGGD